MKKINGIYNDLDPVLHSQVRLAIVSILIGVEDVEFTYLREELNTTAGNLSFQIAKLNEVGYIKVSKGFKNNYPLTTLKLTAKGRRAFEDYVKSIRNYLKL
jgi:DNA-binding MarR family transcriptional regulator